MDAKIIDSGALPPFPERMGAYESQVKTVCNNRIDCAPNHDGSYLSRKATVRAAHFAISQAVQTEPTDVDALLAYSYSVDMASERPDAKGSWTSQDAFEATAAAFDLAPEKSAWRYLQVACGYVIDLTDLDRPKDAMEIADKVTRQFDNVTLVVPADRTVLGSLQIMRAKARAAAGEPKEALQDALMVKGHEDRSEVIELAFAAGDTDAAAQVVENNYQKAIQVKDKDSESKFVYGLMIYNELAKESEDLNACKAGVIKIEQGIKSGILTDPDEIDRILRRSAFVLPMLSTLHTAREANLLKEPFLYWHLAYISLVARNEPKETVATLVESAKKYAGNHPYSAIYEAFLSDESVEGKIAKVLSAHAQVPDELKDQEWIDDEVKRLREKQVKS